MTDAYFDYFSFDKQTMELRMSQITFTTAAVISHRENLKTVGAVAATTDSQYPLSYSISGGADASKFAIQSIAGGALLSFVTTPDFENPVDADANNSYVIDVLADDGNGTTATQTITVTVTDVDDALEQNEALAVAVATDIANLTLATTALEANKADKAAFELAQQSLTQLQSNFTALNAKVDIADGDTVTAVIDAKVLQLKNDLLNGVAVEFDTFKEVADEFARNGDLIATLENVGAGAIRFDIAQVLTAAQQARARLNLGAASAAEFADYQAAMGNPANYDPVGKYEATKAALL